jgi:hypothetical protein
MVYSDDANVAADIGLYSAARNARSGGGSARRAGLGRSFPEDLPECLGTGLRG